MINKNIFLLIIFLKIIIIFFLFSFKNINSFIKKNIVEIDNKINETIYENDLDFNKYEANIKVIAIYFPQFVYLKDNFICNNKEFKEWAIIEKVKPLFEGHHQPRKKDKKYFNIQLKNFSKIGFIKKQIKLAKNHGIYGFGIIYFWISGYKLFNGPINIFIKKEINFPFFLIWKNNKYEINNKNKNIIIENSYNNEEAFMFIVDIKKYLISKNYIKIKRKPILAIYDPSLIDNLREFLYILRNDAKKLGINEIFIYGTINGNEDLNYTKLFDYCFEFPPKNINLNVIIKNKNFFYYTGLKYGNNIYVNNNKIYRGIMLEWDNTPENKSIIFSEYSPEKLYLITKLLINFSSIGINKTNNFIFIIPYIIIIINLSF